MPLRSQSPKRVGSGPLGPPNSGGNFWLSFLRAAGLGFRLGALAGFGDAGGDRLRVVSA